jgi:hypothetical protein
MPNLFLRTALPLAAGVLLLAGCSTEKPGTASPASSTSVVPTSPTSGSGSETPGPSITSTIDPCTLLSAAELSPYGTFKAPTRSEQGSDARDCQYTKSQASASEDSLTVAVVVRDKASVDDIPASAGTLTKGTQNGRTAVQIKNTAGGCAIAMAVGNSARVDVTVVSTNNAATCDIASKVADIVEPKLPKD